MVEIEIYVPRLVEALQRNFGKRLLYVGLQGSYLRGEATESSDLDIMVILDALSVSDLACYRSIVNGMEHADKSCGFICAAADLANWNPLEIWSLVNGTKDYYGSLEHFVPAYTKDDIRNFTKMSLNNLYHELCHRYIHGNPENTELALPGMYKSAFFLLQSLYYLDHEKYIGTKKLLLSKLLGNDRCVLEYAMDLEGFSSENFMERFELLFTWCQEKLHTV